MADRSLSSQLTLRMVLKALRCLKPSGGDVCRTPFCLYGQFEHVQEFCLIAARVICFALPFLWRTLFLCLDVRALPSRSRKPSSARLDPALCLVTSFVLVHGFALGAIFCFTMTSCLL
ncbi:MAG: hypothetical protein IIZ09_02950, partial [Ruminococcus sp.]|nr:hypothetical protein [Ruminococcus sp.]